MRSLIKIFKAYAWGIKFLITDPISFVQFHETFQEYQDKLSEQDRLKSAAQSIGFFDLPRKQRRKIARSVLQGKDFV